MDVVPLERIDDRALVQSLRSDLCPACARLKKPAQTLCPGCYFKLPGPMRAALYDRVGDGYQEAVTAAFERLGKMQFLLVS